VSIENTQIIASEAFRALNVLIDQAALEAVGWANMAVEAASRPPEYPDYVSTRTHEEGGNKVDLPITQATLKRIRSLADEALNAINRAGEIQAFKLKLLNDYDFTKGDDTVQRSVFATSRSQHEGASS
jgi:hypothetical protein